ncbi:hypothetical protein V5799_000722 [Amblyomma americanum]|uniref:Uncharacterized protein n=1 Tax=Amblyomma americanum TaxID=6943 RepID=A0AAQ4D287_AMBAM
MEGHEQTSLPSGAGVGLPTSPVVSSPSAPSDPSSPSSSLDKFPQDLETVGTEPFEAAEKGVPADSHAAMVMALTPSDAELHLDQHQEPSSAVLKAAAAFNGLRGTGTKTSPIRSALDDDDSIATAPAEPAAILAPPDAVFRRVDQGCGAAPFMACFAVLVVLAFAAVLALKTTVTMRNSPGDTGGSHFCCPGEVAELVRYVNATLEPCDSFFEFVCSNTAWRKMGNVSSTLPSPLGSNPGMKPSVILTPSGSRSQVSAFLRSMFDSCLHSGADQNVVVGKLAAFLVSTCGVYLRDGGTTNLLSYFLLSNLKYSIPSLVAVTLKGHSAISISLKPQLDFTDHRFQHCLKNSVEKLNNFAGKYVKVAEVTSFASSLQSLYPAGVKVQHYTGLNLSALMQKWDIKKALEVTSIGLKYLTEVSVNGTDQIDALFDALSSTKKGVSDAGASYLLACSVYNGLVELAWPTVHSQSNRLIFCTRQIELMPSIRDIMYTDEFIMPDKKLQVTRVVNSVIEAIQTDPLVSSIFSGTDRTHLETFFAGMALVMPWESARPAVRETSLTQSFLTRILEGRAYEFEAQLNLARWGLPFASSAVERSAGSGRYLSLHKGTNILISPVVYAFIRNDAAHTDVFNTPVIPWSLAESIWRFILTETGLWSDKARLRIKELIGCFREQYLVRGTSGLSTFAEVDIVAASLGLSSVLKSFSEPLWLKVEATGSFWSLSHSQYFYIRETFYRCPVSSDQASRSYVNVPLMHAGTFSRTFQCESLKYMAKRDTCSATSRKNNV